MVQMEMPFKGISYLDLCQAFVQRSITGKRNYEGQFREIILNSGQWFRCWLKDHLWSSRGPPVRWSKTINAILKEGIMLNIHVKLYEI